MTVSAPPALLPHPLAELIPAMSDREYTDLRDDIEANGQREPITLFEGRVLDGRHRARACEELGLSCESHEYEGDDPAQFVISKNLHRRHLTVGQRAFAAQAFLDYEKAQAKERQREGGRTKVSLNSAEASDAKRTAAQAGKRLGVGRDSVERASRLQAERPDLAEEVKAGEMTLHAANRQLRNGEPPERRRPALPAIDTTRGRTVANAHRRKLDKLDGQLGGMARGVTSGINVAAAVAVMTADEITATHRSIASSLKELRNFNMALKEVS